MFRLSGLFVPCLPSPIDLYVDLVVAIVVGLDVCCVFRILLVACCFHAPFGAVKFPADTFDIRARHALLVTLRILALLRHLSTTADARDASGVVKMLKCSARAHFQAWTQRMR